jgi:hypothetical protein
MNLNPETKKELKKILTGLSDETDAREMSVLETSDITATLERNNRDLKVALEKMATLYQKAFEDMQKGLLDGIQGLKTAMEGNKPADWSGFFKDMPTMLSQIGDNTKNTSELIRNLKWNASQQLRDVNGSPINPSIAGFGITATYDDIQLSDYSGDNVGTVKYYQAGQLKAQLALTYDGDGNLIDVERIV